MAYMNKKFIIEILKHMYGKGKAYEEYKDVHGHWYEEIEDGCMILEFANFRIFCYLILILRR